MEIDYNKLLQLSIKAVLAGGREIMDVYNDPKSDFQIERKADNSPLTIADKKAHNAICSILTNSIYPILSEEGEDISYKERSTWSTLWIVDPLDGTKEFIKRNGEFTVNVALVEGDTPTLGAVYIPATQILYFGSKDLGAYKIENINSVKEDETIESLIKKASRLPLKQNREDYVVVTSRSHMDAETEKLVADLRIKHKSVRLEPSGSSIKICLVADGSADLYPRLAPTMEWDTAAGHAVVLAAGKTIIQANTSKPLVYNKEDLLNPSFIVQ